MRHLQFRIKIRNASQPLCGFISTTHLSYLPFSCCFSVFLYFLRFPSSSTFLRLKCLKRFERLKKLCTHATQATRATRALFRHFCSWKNAFKKCNFQKPPPKFPGHLHTVQAPPCFKPLPYPLSYM